MAQMEQEADARAATQSRVRLELLTELVIKDLKVKYKNSTLGFVWTLANPVLYLAVFSLVFGLFLPNNVANFAVYFMAGLLVWNFLSTATLTATGSVVGNANLVKKVPFPRIVLPLSSVGFAGVHFALQLGVFAVFLLLLHRQSFGPQLALAVPALAVLVVLTTALSLIVASLNVAYRDVQHLWELALVAWFWLNPIVYAMTTVRAALSARRLFGVYMLNPMAAVITSMQRAIYRDPGPLAADGYAFYLRWLGVAGVVSLALLAVGLWLFRRFEDTFAEEL
jgi:ABC-2 type transport system permease protein